MRKVTLTSWTLAPEASGLPEPIELTTTSGIQQVVNRKADGLTVSELRQALRVQDAAKSAEGQPSLTLDEADWAYLNGCLAAHKFPYACRAFAEFAESIEKAETYVPPSEG